MKKIYLILLMLPIAACALNKSTQVYTPPTAVNFSNTALIKQDFETTWNNLVKNLSGQYFVINNVSKESRLLNVSFSADNPSNYVDCGMADREFIPGPGAGLRESYSYNVADKSARYKITMPNPQAPLYNLTAAVRNTAKLEGRTNVFLAPKGNNTELRVNTRYILKKNYVSKFLHNNFQGPSGNYTITFNSKQRGTHLLGDEEITCVSTGKIETDIINAAK